MNLVKPCPYCNDDIPDVLYEAHMAGCDDNPNTESHGAVLMRPADDAREDGDDPEARESDTSTELTQSLSDFKRAIEAAEAESGSTQDHRTRPGVDPFDIDIKDVAGAPPEGTKFESEVDDEFMKLVGQLDIDEGIVDVNVALLDDMELSKRFSEVKQALLGRGEMVDPKTQTGRDLHSERGAYLIELRRRGLA